MFICLERGADCLHIVQLMPLHPKTPSSIASFKSTLVLPFWYRLAQVVLETRPLNECSSSSSSSTHTHTHTFNGSLSGTTQVSRYQKGKTNLDFTEARDSGWQWHQLGYMQVCTRSRQTTTPAAHHSYVFLQAGCPSCRPTNSVKALK